MHEDPGISAQGASHALCALHPERGADAGTCSRCGSFMCRECQTEESTTPLCLTCYERYDKPRFVGQVPVLGVLMMVHGVLILFLAGILVIYGAAMIVAFSDLPEPDPAAAEPIMIAEGTMVAMTLVLGGLHLIPGLLSIAAGWRIRTFRSRGLAIAALASGLITMVGCYCAPSSIAMLVWGLVVLLSEGVSRRFALGPRAAT